MEKYSILAEVGRGSFATVYSAIQRQTGAKVALKSARASNREVFARESALMKKCDSPFVIRFIEGFDDGNRLVMVQEFADSGTLDQLVQARQSAGNQFTEEEIWLILAQVLLGIGDVHLASVCHKDIKAQNVFLHKQRLDDAPNALGFVCKIGDFGVSIDFSQKQDKIITHQPATPAYMSPELLENQPFSQKTDVWSAGVLAYFLATWQFPFQSVEDVLQRRAPDLKLTKYSAKLASLIGRMLCFNQKFRPSVEELLEAREIRIAAQEFLPPQLFQQYFPKSSKFFFVKLAETSETSKSGMSRAQTPKISEKEQRDLTNHFAQQQTLERIPGRRVPFRFKFAARQRPEARKSILRQQNTILCADGSGSNVFWLNRDQLQHDIRDYNGIKHFFTQDDLCVSQQATSHAAVFVFDNSKVLLTKCGLQSAFLYLEGSTFLSLAQNAIRELDLVNCLHLKQLDVSGNNLRRLQLADLKRLEVLNAESNKLRELDFSQNMQLKIAYLQRNMLQQLICGAALKKLNVSHNTLKHLDLKVAVQLETVHAASNKLRHICFASAVRVLNASNNLLSAFLIPPDSNLVSLDLSRNQLSDVDFAPARRLRRASVYENCFLELQLAQNALINELLCWGNKCTSLILHSDIRLEALQVNSNRMEELAVPSCEQVIAFGNRLSRLLFADPSRVLTCDLSFNRLNELSFDGFSSLVALNVSNNQLTVLALALPRLKRLFCQANRLESLELRSCFALQDMDASGNRLANVDLSECATLSELDLSCNQLEVLDLQKCTSLTTCIVRQNHLVVLDVSFSIDLSYLDAGCNRLKALICGNNKLLQAILLDKNALLVPQTSKLARPLLGGQQFADYARLKQLNISDTQVSELIIFALPALECVSALRATLDRIEIRSCPRLISLNAEKNRIAKAVFQNCQALRFVTLRDNKLSALDFREAPRLQWLDASRNALTDVDLTNCKHLQTVWLAENVLTRLEMADFPNLRRVALSGNRLCDCIIANCPLLAEADVKRNQLTNVPTIDSFRVCMRQNAIQKATIRELCARIRVLEVDALEIELSNVALEQLFVHAERLAVTNCPGLCLIECNSECTVKCDDDRVLLARR